MTIRIQTPDFVAFCILDDSGHWVEAAAPIIKEMRGWSTQRVLAYCQDKGWQAEVQGIV